MIRRTTPEVEEKAAARMDELYNALTGEGSAGPRQRPRMMLNAGAARQLAGRDRFVYHGRRFEIPHLPAEDGLDLLLIQLAIEEAPHHAADPTTIIGLRIAIEKARALFWKNVRPLDLVDRLFWRWLSNPFGRTTLGETALMLGFFSDARMRRDRFESLGPADEVDALLKHLSTLP